jgi:hypothetical protein
MLLENSIVKKENDFLRSELRKSVKDEGWRRQQDGFNQFKEGALINEVRKANYEKETLLQTFSHFSTSDLPVCFKALAVQEVGEDTEDVPFIDDLKRASERMKSIAET